MSTATKKKPKKKIKSKQMGFKDLVERSSNSDKFPVYLRLAAETGWLSDGLFLTKLTDNEHEKIKEVYSKHKEAKKAEQHPLDNTFPTVGWQITTVKMSGKRANLSTTTGLVTVSVEGELFHALQRRHPEANVYLSQDQTRVVFSEKKTVALLSILQD